MGLEVEGQSQERIFLRTRRAYVDAEIQEPKDLGELYKGSFAPHKEGDRSWTRGRSPDSRLHPTDDRRETKAQREESSSSKSHSESWGEGTGWGRGVEVKDPRNSGLCSCRPGPRRPSLPKLPRPDLPLGATSQRCRPQGLNSTAGRTLRLRTLSPRRGCPSPSPPRSRLSKTAVLCSVQQPD